MKEFIDGLNTRLNIALQSATDREFYQSLYHYFEYIHKTPSLKSILDKSEHEYHWAFSDIWKERRKYTEEELDIKSAEVAKLERFNLYALGCFIEGRIYFPIDDYRNTNDSDERQDPVAVILVKGIDYAIKLNRWSVKYLKNLNRWFEGKRDQYEVDLRRFHLMFLEELAKIKEPVKNKQKVKFVFDSNSGSFEYKGLKGTFSPKSKPFKFIKTLYTSPNYQATYEQLLGVEKATKYSHDVLSEIAKQTKRKLNILTKDKKSRNPDIIKNVSGYGYKLEI